MLLTGDNLKKSPRRLGKFAIYLVVMRFVDLLWWVTPSVWKPGDAWLPWILLLAGTPLLIGGVWLWTWAVQVKTEQPLIPLHDPRVVAELQEAAAHG